MNNAAHAAHPLFIDTSAFFARFNDQDDHHQQATAVFDGISSGNLAYRPLYTSGYVLSELATLTLRKDTHAGAVEALHRVADSPNITVLHPDATAFAAIRHEFGRYSDHQISFVDQSSAVLAREHDITRIFAFDSDFATLGLTRVPVDTGGT
ncbi:type II toxin-antitoxin system VapC family toxin [Halocatena marina]|uniref:type II toxin-antitoxin system VapC family toxin n=1 Tax=Halocatena marina TaxID=2934937 RepID=UPI0020105C04|nr:PIN domain-containing protein [Halocatena marina]